MVNRSDAHSQLAELFKQQKCYRIDELSRRLNYSLISIRRFLKVIGYYSSFTTTVFGSIKILAFASMAI